MVNGKLVLSGQVTGAERDRVTSDGTLAADLGVTETLTANNAEYTITASRTRARRTSSRTTSPASR